MASAITTIGLDHQEYLGHTEESIAFEKGGIIKPFVPIVIGRMGEEAEQVLAPDCAGSVGSPVAAWSGLWH